MPGVKTIGRRRSRTRDFCIAICSVMGLVLVWSRLANLGTSFWSDEAYSAYYYVESRAARHLLRHLRAQQPRALQPVELGHHRRASAGSRRRTGSGASCPALAAVALAAWWAWKRLGPIAATLVVVLATVSPVHLVLTPQARGYGLAMFAGVVMLIGAVRASDSERDPRRRAVRDRRARSASGRCRCSRSPRSRRPACCCGTSSSASATLIACGVIAVRVARAATRRCSAGSCTTRDQQFGSRLAVGRARSPACTTTSRRRRSPTRCRSRCTRRSTRSRRSS